MSDRAFTLLPAGAGDKRTKEVFALSLERITALVGQGFASTMDALDDGSSAPPILISMGSTIAPDATVHVRIRTVSRRAQSLCWPGLQGNGPATSAMASLTPGAPSFGWMGVSVHQPVLADVDL